MSSISIEKANIRNIIKNQREKVFLKSGCLFANIISNHFNKWFRDQKNFKNLAFYYPINTEVDPLPTILSVDNESLKFCLPIVQNKNSPLLFREWRKDSSLINSKFGVKVPKEGEILVPDLIFIPLLAYDNYGFRLGYGGGFYDRTISNLKNKNRKKIFTVGLAFSCQKFAYKLPVEKTDEKIDCVLTEKGFQFFDSLY